MEENKKQGKGLVAVVVVLSILLVGAIGYICYDKFLSEGEKEVVVDNGGVNNTPSQVDDSEPLVQEYEFNLSNISCSESDDNKCVKTLKVAYNNENHDVKIETTKTDEGDTRNFSHKIFLDGKEFYTVDAGSYSIEHAVDNINLSGFVYVVDSKNLVFVLPKYSEKISYYALFFTEDGNFIDELLVDSGWTSFGVDSGNDLDNISNLEFDGHSLMAWDLDCEDNSKAHQKSITIENNKINITVVKTITDVVGGGQGGCKIKLG